MSLTRIRQSDMLPFWSTAAIGCRIACGEIRWVDPHIVCLARKGINSNDEVMPSNSIKSFLLSAKRCQALEVSGA